MSNNYPTSTTLSMEYVSELLHGMYSNDPTILGPNKYFVYDYKCEQCNNLFPLMFHPRIEIFTTRYMRCPSCNSESAQIYRGEK